jgi:hypothetical protein
MRPDASGDGLIRNHLVVTRPMTTAAADRISTGARRRVSLPDAEPRRAVRAIVGSLATSQDVLEFGE